MNWQNLRNKKPREATEFLWKNSRACLWVLETQWWVSAGGRSSSAQRPACLCGGGRRRELLVLAFVLAGLGALHEHGADAADDRYA